MGYIYKITNDVNDKVYIGQTHNSIQDRWKSHKYSSMFSNAPLYRAMRKHGIENFHIEVIEECPQDKLNEREIYWIKQYQSYGKGYNGTRGGDGHWIYEEDVIKDLWNKGYNLKKICVELNIAVGTVKKILRDYPPFIEQREQRYIEASLNKTYDSTPIKQYTLDGEYITTYPSVTEASRQTETDVSTIIRVCKGVSSYANGFQWRYEGDDAPTEAVKTNQMAVYQIKNDEIVGEYESIAEASRQTGFNKSMINRVAHNGKKHKGYYWRFVDDELAQYWKDYYENLPPKERKIPNRKYATGADHYKSVQVMRISTDGDVELFNSLSEAGEALGNVNFGHSIARYLNKDKTYKEFYWKGA